ncbi:hypothetical protein OH77DRAFT_93430 [Trametes cingulata]|nr:hypothetical protein OH77DRAFT_93430 [Trametes cingulata]
MFSSSSAALVGFGFSPSFLFAALALAAAPLSAAARFASISFSEVKQCGNFTVNFVGGKAPAALPLTLSILPLNGTPVFITLPDDAWNATTETGSAINFLPLPAGTEFIASLDDAKGEGTALVSDVLVIDPSDTDDTSCLPTNPAPFVPRYHVDGTLNQCESFNVAYDAAQGVPPPSTVRGFIPKGASFPVNESSPSNETAGVESYVMDAQRGSQVVFLFQDGNGYSESTAPMPIFGNVESSSMCIPMSSLNNASSLESMSSTEHVTPKIAVIVIAVCGGVVAIVAVAMVTWYVIHRRRVRAQKFTKLDEAQSPSARDPEKQQQSQQDARRISPPPQIVTSVNTSPISPVNSNYGELTQYLRNPAYTTLVTPTSPDPKDPFGEQNTGSLLGSLSARESLTAKTPLGATALGRNGATLSPTNGTRNVSATYSAAARSSTLDPSTQPMAGTSPYYGRLALTPDNSLASNAGSILRRPTSTQTSTSVSSQEIDHILEMATIYGANELPDLPRPVVTAPGTLRTSAYMAGRESRRTSAAFSPRQSPTPTRMSPTLARSDSQTLNHSASQSTLRLDRFRGPPLAPLPSSPLPSPSARPSFDAAGVLVRDSSSGVLQVPRPPPQAAALGRSISSATRDSVYTEDGEDGLDGFAMLQPPNRPVAR